MNWREIKKAYEKLDISLRQGRKHIHGWFMWDGRKQWPVQMSHGRGTVPGRVPEKIADQLNLDMDQLRELVRCTIKLDDYVTIMTDKGLL